MVERTGLAAEVGLSRRGLNRLVERATEVAVSRRNRIVGIGIDAEPDEAVAPALFDTVLSAAERREIDRLTTQGARRRLATLVFCAKEACFKAQFPATGAVLEYEDLLVTTAGTSRRTTTLAVTPANDLLTGLTFTTVNACLDGSWVVVAVAATGGADG